MAKKQRLSQCLAQRDTNRATTNKEFTALQKTVKIPELFSGVTKTYEKKREEDDDLPSQAVRVRQRVADILDSFKELATTQLNAEATVDMANTTARSSVTMENGDVLLENVPVTTLLTLQRDLTQVKSFLASLPTLDPAQAWSKDSAAGVFKTEQTKTSRTQKVQKPVVMYDATDKHPAQTQMVTEDVNVGTWVTIHASGAIPEDEKKALVKKTDQLILAVQSAREEANSITTEVVDVATPIFGYIFGE